jgi:signal transduction histidine kinase
MIFQSLFFEDFYVKRKMNRLSDNVIQFSNVYKKAAINDYSSIKRLLNQFEEDNNAKVLLLNSHGEIIAASGNQPQDDTSKIDALWQLFEYWSHNPNVLDDIIVSNHISTSIFDNTDYHVKNITCAYPITLNTSTYLLVAVSSLQPIEEASTIIREFYIYFFIFAVIVILILSFIYSNMISKPLVRLNNIASKMANLDFSSFCDVKSNDELGNLGNTLNFLSFNLDNALQDLKASNKKLQSDIERERHLDKMRKEFTAGVSHELKTPISLISGYAEGLKDGIVDEESQDFYLDVIMDEANKMSNLVSDMLDLSQLESGTFKLSVDSFYIDKLFISLLKKHSTFMNSKNISIETNIDKDLLVSGDVTRIEQVITNFLTNAIRHTPENGVIKVTIKDMENKNNKIVIEIFNSGEPIDDDDLQNIWDKFYKIDKSRTRTDGGTGLGLSIVKNILTLHKSDFGVKNESNGVLFYFTLEKEL